MAFSNDFRNALNRIITNSGIFHNVIHGSSTETVTTESGEVNTVARALEISKTFVSHLTESRDGAGGVQSGGVVIANKLPVCWGIGLNNQLGINLPAYDTRIPLNPNLPNIGNLTVTKWIKFAYENFLILSNGDIYVWGRNENGLYGLGHTNTITNPTKIAFFDGINITDVSVSSQAGTSITHALYLTDTGRVYSCGYGLGSALGIESLQFQITTPHLITETGFASIYATSFASYALKTNGELWSWGLAEQNGRNSDVASENSLPNKITAFGDETITKFSSSAEHFIALSNLGKVYTWGSRNNEGQLGQGNNETLTLPTHVAALGTDNKDVFAIGQTLGNSYVLKSNNDIWGCGENRFGQLSASSALQISQDSNVFRELFVVGFSHIADIGSNIIKVLPYASNPENTFRGNSSGGLIFLTADGRIYGTGANTLGQLGNSRTFDINLMRESVFAGKAVDISLVGYGDDTSLCVLDDEGYYYQTGSTGTSLNGYQVPYIDSNISYLSRISI